MTDAPTNEQTETDPAIAGVDASAADAVQEAAVDGAEPALGSPTPEELAPAEPAPEDPAPAEPASASAPEVAASTLDDIAPGTVVTPEAPAIVAATESTIVPEAGVSVWPFVVYDAIWALAAGATVYFLRTLPAGTAVYESDAYRISLATGIALTAVSPFLIVATWLVALDRPGTTKGHLFVSALFKGAMATALGVTLWWSALIALDVLRLGRPF